MAFGLLGNREKSAFLFSFPLISSPPSFANKFLSRETSGYETVTIAFNKDSFLANTFFPVFSTFSRWCKRWQIQSIFVRFNYLYCQWNSGPYSLICLKKAYPLHRALLHKLYPWPTLTLCSINYTVIEYTYFNMSRNCKCWPLFQNEERERRQKGVRLLFWKEYRNASI